MKQAVLGLAIMLLGHPITCFAQATEQKATEDANFREIFAEWKSLETGQTPPLAAVLEARELAAKVDTRPAGSVAEQSASSYSPPRQAGNASDWREREMHRLSGENIRRALRRCHENASCEAWRTVERMHDENGLLMGY